MRRCLIYNSIDAGGRGCCPEIVRLIALKRKSCERKLGFL
jgi:hypothetical protein